MNTVSPGPSAPSGSDPRGTGSRPASESQAVRLTFASGGWVVLLSAVLCVALLAWAFAGVLFGTRPIGDGRSVASYGFSLADLEGDSVEHDEVPETLLDRHGRQERGVHADRPTRKRTPRWARPRAETTLAIR